MSLLRAKSNSTSKKFLILAILISLAIADIFSTETFAIVSNGKFLAGAPMKDQIPFTIKFIHSVQKTPVYEDLIATHDHFELKRTRYQSFGVGLPFLESEGNFYREGDFFIFDNMNRQFENLSLRTGVGTQLTIFLDSRVIRLFELVEDGTRIDLIVDPFWKIFWRDLL